jgi:hypothetical protein
VVWNVLVGGSACFQPIDNRRFTAKVYISFGLRMEEERLGLLALLAGFAPTSIVVIGLG